MPSFVVVYCLRLSSLVRHFYSSVALLSAFATQTTFAEVLGAEVKPVCAGVVIQHLSDAEIAFVGETLASTHNAVHAAAGDGEVIGSLTYSDSITLVGLAAETTPSLKQGGGGWGGGIGCGITCPSGNDDFYGDDFVSFEREFVWFCFETTFSYIWLYF